MQTTYFDGGATHYMPGFTNTVYAPVGGYGTPQHVSQAGIIGSAHNALGQAGAAQASATGNAAAAQYGAYGNAESARYGALANAYSPYAGLLSQAGGNLSQMFDSYGRNSGQYFNAVSNLGANAVMADQNWKTALLGQQASGNNAYQAMLGNLGAAALAGYGGAANTAMQSQAMNSTAFAKAMADATAANQGAMSAYGVGREQSLAALAAAMGSAGGNFANAYAQNAASASQLGGMGAAAYANLGGSLGSSAANISAAQSQGLASLGGSANAAYGSLGGPAAMTAGSDLNYTRDMAKLGLARELGLTGVNAMSSYSGASGGNPAVSLSGPQGEFAFGGGAGYGGGAGGGSGGAALVDPYSNVPWYAAPQSAGGRGLQAISGLSGGIGNSTGSLGGGITGFANQALGFLGREGDSGRAGIADSLLQGAAGINRSFGGIDNASKQTFGGMNTLRGDIVSSPVLGNLAGGYASGMGSLQGLYDTSRGDIANTFGAVSGGLRDIYQPILDRGQQAMDQFYERLPTDWNASSSASPYLSELRSAYQPFISNLNSAYRGSVGALGDLVNRGSEGFASTYGSLSSPTNMGLPASLQGLFGNEAIGGQLLGQVSPYLDRLNPTAAMEAQQAQQALLEQTKLNQMKLELRRKGMY